MIQFILLFFLSFVLVRKLTIRWETKKGACLAAVIGVGSSFVCLPIVGVMLGSLLQYTSSVEGLLSGFAASYLSVIVSPLTALMAWRKANSVHKRLVSKCPQCSTAVGIKDEKCDKCGFDLVRGGAQ